MPSKKTDTLPKFIQKEIDHTGQIAHHYGFTSIISPQITGEDRSKAKSLKEESEYPLLLEERIALLRFFNDRCSRPQNNQPQS